MSRRLNRIVSHGKRFIPEVDGLRFVAVSAVVLLHLRGLTITRHMAGAAIRPSERWLYGILSIGHCGVQLFFVLSGFLLALPFARWRLGMGKEPSLGSYYLRRLTRLEPPYIVLMLLVFVGHLFVSGMSKGLLLLPRLLAGLVYQHNLIYHGFNAINLVAWTLEVEVQFYCLAPFLAGLFSIRNTMVRRVTFAAIMGALPFFRSFVPAELGVRYNSLPWHLEFFIAGFFLADLFLVEWKGLPVRSLAWDGFSLLAWPAFVTLLLYKRLPILLAPVILLAYVGAFKGKVSSWLLSRPLVTSIGGMCYTIYLAHLPVMSATERLSSRILWGAGFFSRFMADAIVAIPVTLGITVLIFIALERPCMDPEWFARLRARLRSRTGIAGLQEQAPGLSCPEPDAGD
jgi:peptidoglycan/LPS O-acetylase OafA/YrhL